MSTHRRRRSLAVLFFLTQISIYFAPNPLSLSLRQNGHFHLNGKNVKEFWMTGNAIKGITAKFFNTYDIYNEVGYHWSRDELKNGCWKYVVGQDLDTRWGILQKIFLSPFDKQSAAIFEDWIPRRHDGTGVISPDLWLGVRIPLCGLLKRR